ncbi:MAG: cupin domain-containing protein, partial [Terriglobia bacterium]
PFRRFHTDSSGLTNLPMPDSAARSSLPAKKSFPSEFNPSLEWLINPTRKQQFFETNWEKQPLVVKRNQRDYFGALLSLDEVDRVITTLDRRYPDVTLKNASREITDDDYTVGGDSLDVAKVYQLFAEGSTISLAFLDTVVPPLALFCRSLESEFSFPFQANVYLTPPGAQGAKPHYDTHDVFVLQVTGSKKWTIYGTPVELPLPGQDFDASIHELGAPTLEFELEAGDVAYIPRGIAHDAHSTDTVSLHITAGVLRYTWADLLLELVANASLNDPAFRKSLPPGFVRPEFDRTQARETLRTLLQRVPAGSNFDAVLDRFTDEFISACPPLLRGQMAQMASLDRLAVDSVVGARAGVIFRLLADEKSVSIDCHGRKISFPPYTHEAVRSALATSRFTVRDLPGGLDDAGKLTLIRRLIREGLVMALPD